MAKPANPGRPLKVLFVAAEVAPFAAIGGLSQVMYFLPRALKKKGLDVRIFMPRFGSIDEEKWGIKLFKKGLKVPTDEKEGKTELVCNIKEYKGGRFDPTVYFLENMEYYEKRANVYGYSDDHIRFALLSRGALEFLRSFSWRPDVINASDWHTGYLVNYLRTTYNDDPRLAKIATVFSIHNLPYQGNFDFKFASELDFDDGKSPLASFFSDRLQKQNSMKRGIIYAEVVNTVSETYSHEILTPEYGEGLDQLLKEVRTKVFGVLNGIDYDDFDPATDKIIKTNFGVNSLELRVENKIDLQREFNLPADGTIPILAMSGRLADQKGIDLLIEVLPFLLSEYNIQFIVMGGGDNRYRAFFSELESKFPQKVGTHLMPNFTLPRKIFAGSDMFVLPSKFEPGGIVVIEAMRYGSVPVVRATGGCADTVTDFDPATNTGTGFSFKNYNPMSFFATVIRALEVYKNQRVWRGIVRRAMREDFSWEHSAERYIDLYKRAIEFRKEALSPKPSLARQPEV